MDFHFFSLDESTLEGLLEEVAVVVKPLVKERPQQMAPVLTSVLVNIFHSVTSDICVA